MGREWEGGLKKRVEGMGALRMPLEQEMGVVEKEGWLSLEVVVAAVVVEQVGFNKIEAMEKD